MTNEKCSILSVDVVYLVIVMLLTLCFLGAKNAFPTRESISRASGGRPDSGGHLPKSGNIKNVKWKEGKQYTPRPRRFRK